MADLNLIVEPPKRQGSRTTEVDPKLLAAMKAQFGKDNWIGDGKTYKTGKEAGNAVASYRRALASDLGIPEHTIKTKAWGEDAKGSLITDRKKPGTWRVAMQHAPDRVKRTRATTPAATPA